LEWTLGVLSTLERDDAEPLELADSKARAGSGRVSARAGVWLSDWS